MVGTEATEHVLDEIPVNEPTGGGHPAVALGALSVTYAIAATAIVLFVVNRSEWHPGQWYFLVDLADALVYGAVGWLLLTRVDRPVAWIVAGCAFGGALAALSVQWTTFQLEHPDLPRLDRLATMQNWAWVPGTLALILIAPWLIRHRPLDAVGRIGVTIGTVVTVGMVLFRWTDPYPWPDEPSVMLFAIENEWWGRNYDAFGQAFMAAIVVVGLAAALDVTRRWAKPVGAMSRRGLGWLAIGGGVMSITFLPLALPESWVEWMPVATTPLLHLTSQLFFPAALLVAVLGQRLWGLQLAVSRAVGWSLLTATLIAAYVIVATVVGLLLPSLDDGAEQVAAAALVAAAVDPIRRFVQRRVDRLVHGDSREPLVAVDRLGARLGGAAEPDRLLAGVLEGIVDSLRLAGAAIDVSPREQIGTLTVGDTSGRDEVVVPLVLDDELVGALTAWPRPGERLDQRTRRALDALVPTVAVAALLAVKAAELAESRARLVSARDEERRAIRRELHDGLGPALAGLGYGIGAARNLLSTDRRAADELLRRLSEEIDGRVEDVRTLARELVPPVLLEAGLGAALHELAERVRLGGLRVSLDLEADLDVGPDLAGTLYGISAEALRNVVRHADASEVTLSLQRAEGDLVLEVADDGVGIGDDVVTGVGLQSMRERADAIDAAFDITRRPEGGSVVAVRVPLRRVVTS